MFFSQIISEITKKHPVRVVCVSDIYDIRDIALLDGQQSEFANHTREWKIAVMQEALSYLGDPHLALPNIKNTIIE